MSATFHEYGVSAKLKSRRLLSRFLDQLIAEYRPGTAARLTYILCNDAYLLDINLRFLNHDDLTDIITFDLSENERELQGEIYISVERVGDNAGRFSMTYQQELHRVIFHGALHLCGLRDKLREEKAAMRAAEEAALNDWQIFCKQQ